MAVLSKPGWPPSQSLAEYCVGAAQNECIYPGILQCISLTGFSPHGLLGAHVSPGISEDDLEMTFNVLRMGGGGAIATWYVVGNFIKHFAAIKLKSWNSKTKIAKEIRRNLGGGSSIYMFDTSEIGALISGLGIDIFATHHTHGVNFAYRRSGNSGMLLPRTPITDPFLTY